MPRFPFSWGATVPAAVVAPPVPPFWRSVTGTSLHWYRVRAALLPRFEHVFPQESGAAQQFVKRPPPD